MSPIIRAQRNHPKRHDDTEQKDTPQPDPALRSASSFHLFFQFPTAPPVLSPILLLHFAPSIFPPYVGRCYKN